MRIHSSPFRHRNSRMPLRVSISHGAVERVASRCGVATVLAVGMLMTSLGCATSRCSKVDRGVVGHGASEPSLESSTVTSVDELPSLERIEYCSDGTLLIGRLVLPEGSGPFPLVVLVHGSGREATRHSLDFIVEPLVSAGYAAFVPDKRGTGESGGSVPDVGGGRTDEAIETRVNDVLASLSWLTRLEEIDGSRTGLMGASQAGWVIPAVAAESKAVAFTVVVNGSTLPVFENLHWEKIGTANEDEAGWWFLRPMDESERDALSEQLRQFSGKPGYDPLESLTAQSVPGLWLWGDLDTRVPARESAEVIRRLIDEQAKPFDIHYDDTSGHHWSRAKTRAIMDWMAALAERSQTLVDPPVD